MLRGVWSLHDVVDVEELCRGVLREMTAMRTPKRGGGHETFRPTDASKMRLTEAEFEDSLRHLLGEVVILERSYDATRERDGIRFRPWLYQRLRFRLIDYWRMQFGRNGQRRVVDYRLADGAFDDDGADGEDRLARAAAERAGNDPDGWALDCGGLLTVADRQGAGNHRGRGSSSAERAA